MLNTLDETLIDQVIYKRLVGARQLIVLVLLDNDTHRSCYSSVALRRLAWKKADIAPNMIRANTFNCCPRIKLRCHIFRAVFVGVRGG